MIKTILLTIVGVLIAAYLLLYFGTMYAQKVNLFEEEYSLSVQIENYNEIKNEVRPTEVVMSLDVGNPMRFESITTHYVFNIDESGLVEIRGIKGHKEHFVFRNSKVRFTINTKIANNTSNRIRLESIVASERNFKNESHLNYKYVTPKMSKK